MNRASARIGARRGLAVLLSAAMGLPPALAQGARVTGRVVQFPAHDALEVEKYLTAVREAGLLAHDVEIRKADLEDVFLDVMTQHKDSVHSVGATR